MQLSGLLTTATTFASLAARFVTLATNQTISADKTFSGTVVLGAAYFASTPQWQQSAVLTANTVLTNVNSVILADTTAGNITLTLPTTGTSRIMFFKNLGSLNTATLQAPAGGLIDGIAGLSLDPLQACVLVRAPVATANAWAVLSHYAV